MTQSQQELLQNINGIRAAANESLLQRLAPTAANKVNNTMAELLRRGLYVVAFNAIEDFLKKRVAEHFNNLPTISNLDFDDLPPSLQRAAVIDAMKNGVREAGYDRANQMQIIRTVAGAVASTDTRSQYSIHEYSLLRNGSNVSATDIGAALGTMHINKPWQQMQKLLNLVGNVGTPIQDRFESCALKRNAAAHGGQRIEYSDLVEITDLAVPLCFAFDITFSAGMTRIADGIPTAASDAKIEVAGNIDMRFVSERPRGWCRLNQRRQPSKYFANQKDAVQHALGTIAAPDVVVTLGSHGEIAEWHLADHRHP